MRTLSQRGVQRPSPRRAKHIAQKTLSLSHQSVERSERSHSITAHSMAGTTARSTRCAHEYSAKHSERTAARVAHRTAHIQRNARRAKSRIAQRLTQHRAPTAGPPDTALHGISTETQRSTVQYSEAQCTTARYTAQHRASPCITAQQHGALRGTPPQRVAHRSIAQNGAAGHRHDHGSHGICAR